MSDDSRLEKGGFTVCASVRCLRQNAGKMQRIATALRYRLHASPNPYVRTRALPVFRLVSLSKLSRSAKQDARDKRRRGVLARGNRGNRAARPQTVIDSRNSVPIVLSRRRHRVPSLV